MAFIEMDFASGGGGGMKGIAELLCTIGGDGTYPLANKLSDYKFIYARYGTNTGKWGSSETICISAMPSECYLNAVESGAFNAKVNCNFTDNQVVASYFGRTGWVEGQFYIYGIK